MQNHKTKQTPQYQTKAQYKKHDTKHTLLKTSNTKQATKLTNNTTRNNTTLKHTIRNNTHYTNTHNTNTNAILNNPKTHTKTKKNKKKRKHTIRTNTSIFSKKKKHNSTKHNPNTLY